MGTKRSGSAKYFSNLLGLAWYLAVSFSALHCTASMPTTGWVGCSSLIAIWQPFFSRSSPVMTPLALGLATWVLASHWGKPFSLASATPARLNATAAANRNLLRCMVYSPFLGV